MVVPVKSMLKRSESTDFSGDCPADFSEWCDSPVSADCSAARFTDSIILMSAGTRLPSESSTTSPATRCTDSSSTSLPPRSTTERCTTIFFRASSAASARYSCQKENRTAMSTAASMAIASMSFFPSSVRPRKSEIAAAARSSIMGSDLNCERSIAYQGSFLISTSLFSPYFSRRDSASFCDKPFSDVPISR